MCTVTYLPKGNGNYILTSSRDEKIIRASALEPEEYSLFGKTILFPKDPVAGGTWIAYGNKRTACLLNGGLQKHIPVPPYKKSRGLVLLDYFSYEDTLTFIAQYDFQGIEPFTLVLLEKNQLLELRWDSEQLHFFQHSPDSPRIWSSVTLYPEEVIRKRNLWFTRWLSDNSVYQPENIRSFHRQAGEGDPENDVLMNRNDALKTVSITTIEKRASSLSFLYEDLINKSLVAREVLFSEL